METMHRRFSVEAVTINSHVGMAFTKKEKKTRLTAARMTINAHTSIVLAQEVQSLRARAALRRLLDDDLWHVVGPRFSLDRVGTFVALRKSEFELVREVRRRISDKLEGPDNKPNLWPARELTAAVAIHKASDRKFKVSSLHPWYADYDKIEKGLGLAAQGHNKQVDEVVGWHAPNENPADRILDLSGGDGNEPMSREKQTLIERKFAKIGMLPAHKVTRHGYDKVRLDDFFVSDGLRVERRLVMNFTDGDWGVDHPFIKVNLSFTK